MALACYERGNTGVGENVLANLQAKWIVQPKVFSQRQIHGDFYRFHLRCTISGF